jgi:tetratricopeptide (TPR) repeat protein
VAHLAVAQGDDRLARAELETAESLDRTWGLEMRALFSVLPFRRVSEAELREVRHSLEEWNPADVAPSMFLVFAMHNELHPALRLYLLGLIDVRLGEIPSARRWAEELSPLAGAAEGLGVSLLLELQAAIAQREGRPEEALRILERSHPRLWFQLTVASPFYSLASQRYLRAELLRQLGRHQEAAGWYRSIAERSPYELVYAAPSRERLAEMSRVALSR